MCWVFIAGSGFATVAVPGLLTVVLPLLQSTGSRHLASVVVVCGLSSRGLKAPELGLHSCGSPAWMLCGTWDLPGPGIEPMSLALQGRFLTTGPPGKFWTLAVLALIYMRQHILSAQSAQSLKFIWGLEARIYVFQFAIPLKRLNASFIPVPEFLIPF